MLEVDGAFIRLIAPKYTGDKAKRQDRIIDAIGPVFANYLYQSDISTPLRIAHFAAQVTHECAGFCTTEEFASGDAYEGRIDLGNLSPGDGRRYKGRGLLQLTGRANYARLGADLGLPLQDNPDLAAEPIVSLSIACSYWRNRQINFVADQDDLVAVTRKVNGGTNGLAERSRYLKAAKTALAALQAHDSMRSRPTLFRGVVDPAVGELQRLMRQDGFLLAIDNEFGAATRLRRFKKPPEWRMTE